MPERVERRLAAILAGDVAGYSRLMGADEVRTVTALRSHRKEVIDPKLAEHRGRLVNTAGDSVLVEFPSVLDAVRCAVEVQQTMAARNASVPEDQRIVFRIGINIGDVIFQDGEVYGDGVNIAARLEQIGDPGGILVSRTVREQVGDKLPYAFDDLGPREVKNIAQPVEVWRVGFEGAPSSAKPHASKALKSHSSDARPGIAVLPFQNMSGDAEQEYFSDGLTEDLITDLAAFPQLRVIARNTMFTYKGKPVNVPQVGRELDVSHVVEGSVRKAGNRIRLTAQLIEATTGSHVWAERFDRELTDVFAIQDEIVRATVTELHVKLLEGEQARSWRKGTNNAQAYDYFLSAMQGRHHAGSRQFIERDVNLLNKVLALDPGFAHAHAHLATKYRLSVVSGIAHDPQQALSEAARHAQRAIKIDPSLAEGHAELGLVALMRNAFDEGEALLRKAQILAPDSSDNLGLVALGLTLLGQHGEAIAIADQAIALAPHHPPSIDAIRGVALFHLGRFSEALESFGAARTRGFGYPFVTAYAAAAHAALGQEQEARIAVGKLLEIEPGLSLEAWPILNRLRLTKDRDLLKRNLLKAGLPE